MNKVHDYPTLLEAIRKRPCMYHGGEERNVELLAAFLGGIGYVQTFQNIPTECLLDNFNWKEFEQWVASEFNKKRLSLNSLTLSRHLSSSNSEAFDLWFKWYDQFRESNSNATP